MKRNEIVYAIIPRWASAPTKVLQAKVLNVGTNCRGVVNRYDLMLVDEERPEYIGEYDRIDIKRGISKENVFRDKTKAEKTLFVRNLQKGKQ